VPTYAGSTGAEQVDDASSAVPPPLEASPRGGMFGSLRERNYRLYAGGQIVSLIGTWMQRVAQDWLVLELSGKSPVALGIAAALQFIPTLVLSLWAGVLADRMDKRKLLMVVQACMGLCALVLGLLDVTGLARLWQVYLFCLVLGCFSAIETPVRQSFVVEMVGRNHVTNAVALNSMTFNLARIVGPAIAGFLITKIDTGWVFLGNFVSFAAVLMGLFLMDPWRLHRVEPVPRSRGQLMAGLRYVRRRSDLVVLLALVFLVSTFGVTFFTTLAVAAANVFGQGADGYGLLSTMLAIGTLAGAVLAARRSTRGRPRLRLLFGSALVFGVLEVLLGAMPTYSAFALMLIPIGVLVITFLNTANSTVQLSVNPTVRGRVMGLYMLVLLGGTPLGGPLTGWLAEQFGGRSPFIVGGIVSVAAAVLCALALARSGGVALPRFVVSRRRRGGV